MKHIKIPDSEVRNIHRLRAEGWTYRRLAVEFDCSIGQVERILTGGSRQDIWLEFNNPVTDPTLHPVEPEIPVEKKEEYDAIFDRLLKAHGPKREQ